MPAQRIPRDPAKKRAWIQYQLRQRNLTLAEIARQLEVSKAAVSQAIDRPSQRIQAAIAAALNVDPAEIWPERYREPPDLDLSHIDACRSDKTHPEVSCNSIIPDQN
jgi:Ner family transcriptional regulator